MYVAILAVYAILTIGLLIFIGVKFKNFHVRILLLGLVMLVMAVVVSVTMRVASSQRDNQVEKLIAGGQFEEAIQYVREKKSSFSETEREQVYIKVFTAALPGCYAGQQEESAAITYLYIPESISYSMTMDSGSRNSNTIKKIKSDSFLYVFTSEEGLTAEMIREKALADPNSRVEYICLELHRHYSNPYVTEFYVKRKETSEANPLSGTLYFDLNDGSLSGESIRWTRVSDDGQ